MPEVLDQSWKTILRDDLSVLVFMEPVDHRRSNPVSARTALATAASTSGTLLASPIACELENRDEIGLIVPCASRSR